MLCIFSAAGQKSRFLRGAKSTANADMFLQFVLQLLKKKKNPRYCSAYRVLDSDLFD